MLIEKLNLYNPEWLELVFDNKNKDYGAYDLRKHYAGNQVKAMGITFIGVAVLITAYTIFKPKTEFVRVTEFKPLVAITPDLKKPAITPPKAEPPRIHKQITTVKYPVIVPKEDKLAENPPKITELEGKAIGTENKKGSDDGVNIDLPVDGSGSGTMKDVIEDTEPKNITEVQVLPQPYGGEAAWAKFLQKNLHYPNAAVDAHIQGKVFLSFIIEKDGHLSNIVVERGVGYGLDEEAVRVLKLAPAWKPGIQNGHQVRVKFTMPISFMLNDDNN